MISIADLQALDRRCATIAARAAEDPAGDEAVSDLLAALHEADWRARSAAVRALVTLLARGDGAIAARQEEVFAALDQVALFDAHLWVRQAASSLVARSPASVNRLAGALEYADAAVRERALRALRAAGDQAIVATGAILARLADPAFRVRAAAAEALGAQAVPSETTLAALAASVTADGDPSVRVAAIDALVSARAVDRDDAFAALVSAADDADPGAAVAAFEALRGCQRPDRGERLLDVVRRRVVGSAPPVRIAALRVIATLGEASGPAIDAVFAAAADRGWGVREEALFVFNELAQRTPRLAEERIAELAASSMPGERFVALRLLHGLDRVPAGLEAVLWSAAIHDRDARTRGLARELMARLSTAIPVDYLEPLLAHGNPSVRKRAAGALGALGPAASVAIPSLNRILHDGSHKVRRAAVQAVCALGPLASSTAPRVLRRVFEHYLHDLATGALDAIKPPLSARVQALLTQAAAGSGQPQQLYDLLSQGLPPDVEAELVRVGAARVRWLNSLSPLAAKVPGPEEPLRSPAAVAAAVEAASRHLVRRPGPDREAVWHLGFLIQTLLASGY